MDTKIREAFLDEEYENYCRNLKEAQALLAQELSGIFEAKKNKGQEISKAYMEVNRVLGSKIRTIEVYGIGSNGKCAVDKDGNFYASDWASSNSAKMNVSPKMRDYLIHKADGVGYVLRGKRDARDVADVLIGCKMHKDKYIRWIDETQVYNSAVHLGREIYVSDSNSIKAIYEHDSEGRYCYGYDVYGSDMSDFENDSHELIRTGRIRELVDHIIRINIGEEETDSEIL